LCCGAPPQGAFHESFNLAGTRQIPLVGVIENNPYGEMSGIEEQDPPATQDDFSI
jgi:TPP-dependent pyruvate/acetoin dehydrogenase alpha subunit